MLAVNRAARDRPQAAKDAAEAAARVRDTQLSGEQDAYRAAVADLDRALDLLAEVAVAHVGGKGKKPTDAMRQPGSSFKPYVYAAALMHGLKPTSIVVDGPVCIGNWCPHNYGHGYAGSMTLLMALTKSINTIAVKLSITIGNGNAKVGRAKIVKLAHDMGLRTPLPDTPSLPIGAD